MQSSASAPIGATAPGLSDVFSRMLPLLWLAGALLVLIPALIGQARLRGWREVRGRPDEPAWSALMDEALRAVGITRPVVLLISERIAMPMTWGCLRPHVLMLVGAADWSVERQRAVLLHELAHVRRADCLTQMLAQLACAVLWFHPLVWIAAHQLRTERERACDDVVLLAPRPGPPITPNTFWQWFGRFAIWEARFSVRSPSLGPRGWRAGCSPCSMPAAAVMVCRPRTPCGSR